MSGFFIFKKKIYISNKKNIYGKGFKLLFDLIYFSKEPLKIKEYMIIFNKRKYNKSKMNLKVIFHIFVAIFYDMLMKLLRSLFLIFNIFVVFYKMDFNTTPPIHMLHLFRPAPALQDFVFNVFDDS